MKLKLQLQHIKPFALLLPLIVGLLLRVPAPDQAPSGDAGCGAATPATTSPPATPGSPAPITSRRIDLGQGAGEALTWAAGGPGGIVLVHGAIYDAASWEPQATVIAAAGLSVIAVENASASAVAEATTYLRDELDVETVTLVGASAGGSAALSALADDPELADRLVLLSATGKASELGTYPKLLVASEGEGLADRMNAMAGDAPGTENGVLIIPGDAHAQAIFKTGEGDRLLAALIRFASTGCA